MKNNKGQMGIGSFLVLFISVIVGLALILPIAQSVGSATNGADSVGNVTITVPADGVSIDLTGQELMSVPTVNNVTSGTSETLAAGNYTIEEAVDSQGVKGIVYTAEGSEAEGLSMYVAYTYAPDGYIDNAGARGLANMIIIFACLAIAVIVMGPVVKDGISKFS